MSTTQQRSASDSIFHPLAQMPAPPTATPPRKRASTVQVSGIPAIPEARHFDGSPGMARDRVDVFETHEGQDEHDQGVDGTPVLKLPSTFDELPIEIKSLSERFLESLLAKVHPTPLTADALSELFQDFYERAASHISTHIASLASRIGRETKTTPSRQGTGRARAGSGAKRNDSPASSGGEMLTASEVANRRKARKLLELKKVALEEAVERGVCEKVYDRIFKHRSTDDEARDEKLRSRTAALSVVGIGLKELHMDSDPAKEDVRKTAEEKEDEIHRSLAVAREALQKMDDEHYPAGKLQHLTAAHKSIVETLAQNFPSSSSADEILPTLIYTLITSPPEGINVVSNLNFIQRFRAAGKVDGEAAYCLVNLEAAISFLETVDLSSLRADELPEGPAKSSGSRPSTPTSEKEKLAPPQPTAAKTLKPTISPLSAGSTELSSSPYEMSKAPTLPRTPTTQATRPNTQHRRLSSLVQAQADKLEAGREGFLNAADKVYDSINGTLESSLQFVFGRFKEQAAGNSPLPKTLEDARKLVSSPSAEENEEALSNSGRSSPALDDPLNAGGKGEDKMLELIGGCNLPIRDRSVDSARSGGSGKRVATTELASKDKPKEEATTPGANLFNAINPLNRFGISGFTRFGRSASGNQNSSSPAQPSPTAEKPNRLDNIVESAAQSDDGEPFPILEKQSTKDSVADVDEGDEMNAREALAELRRFKAPKNRFLEVAGASELKLGEVEELLMDYRRLAKAIGDAVVS